MWNYDIVPFIYLIIHSQIQITHAVIVTVVDGWERKKENKTEGRKEGREGKIKIEIKIRKIHNLLLP